MIYLTMLKTDNKYYLLTDDDGKLIASESAVDAIRSIEDGYASAIGRSYEGAMSATVNYCFFQYSIVALENKEAIGEVLVGPPYHIVSGGNVSGRFMGMECVKEKAEPLFEKGDKPRLLPGR